MPAPQGARREPAGSIRPTSNAVGWDASAAGSRRIHETGHFSFSEQSDMSWPSCDGRSIGEVAERSNATDCKSVALAASEVRILPSPPASARRSGTRSGRRRGSAGRPDAVAWRAGRTDAAGSPADERVERPRPAGTREGGLARRSEGHTDREGGSNSVVESQPSKLLVAGSIPVSRSSLRSRHELRPAGQPSVATTRKAVRR